MDITIGFYAKFCIKMVCFIKIGPFFNSAALGGLGGKMAAPGRRRRLYKDFYIHGPETLSDVAAECTGNVLWLKTFYLTSKLEKHHVLFKQIYFIVNSCMKDENLHGKSPFHGDSYKKKFATFWYVFSELQGIIYHHCLEKIYLTSRPTQSCFLYSFLYFLNVKRWR